MSCIVRYHSSVFEIQRFTLALLNNLTMDFDGFELNIFQSLALIRKITQTLVADLWIPTANQAWIIQRRKSRSLIQYCTSPKKQKFYSLPNDTLRFDVSSQRPNYFATKAWKLVTRNWLVRKTFAACWCCNPLSTLATYWSWSREILLLEPQRRLNTSITSRSREKSCVARHEVFLRVVVSHCERRERVLRRFPGVIHSWMRSDLLQRSFLLRLFHRLLVQFLTRHLLTWLQRLNGLQVL